jgi:hypothetical protein
MIIIKQIVVATVLTVLVVTSSAAIAQTSTPSGTASEGGATTGTGRDIADPTRHGAEQPPSAGDRAGSGAPGTRTTGAGMQESDRAMGSKSGN